MHGMRRQQDSTFKVMVALEAIKGKKTTAQHLGEFGFHPDQIRQWRDMVLKGRPRVYCLKIECPAILFPNLLINLRTI